MSWTIQLLSILKMATAVVAGTLVNTKHSTWLTHENWSYTLNASRQNEKTNGQELQAILCYLSPTCLWLYCLQYRRVGEVAARARRTVTLWELMFSRQWWWDLMFSWVLEQFRLVGTSHRFGQTYHLHLQGAKI
jgi:hypothetical protein